MFSKKNFCLLKRGPNFCKNRLKMLCDGLLDWLTGGEWFGDWLDDDLVVQIPHLNDSVTATRVESLPVWTDCQSITGRSPTVQLAHLFRTSLYQEKNWINSRADITNKDSRLLCKKHRVLKPQWLKFKEISKKNNFLLDFFSINDDSNGEKAY